MRGKTGYNNEELPMLWHKPAFILAGLAVLLVGHCPTASACSPQVSIQFTGAPVAENAELPWASITVTSSGGPSNGSVSLKWASTGDGTVEFWDSAFNQITGNEVTCPPNDQVGTAFYIRGLNASSVVNDVVLTIQWKDQQGGLIGAPTTTSMTVVKVGLVEFKKSTDTEWRKYVDRIYVLVGDTVNFRAVPSPGQTWPANKPNWGGEGGTATGATKDVTFSGAGNKSVIVYCDNNVTLDVTVLGAGDVVVEFSKNEVRPGYSGAAREESVTATARRAAGGDPVTIDLSTTNAQRATVSAPSPAQFVLAQGQTTSQTTVTVRGATSAPANRDTKLEAKAGQATVGSIPITVTWPANWHSQALTAEMTCSMGQDVWQYHGLPGWYAVFDINDVFEVRDFFDEPLRPQWAGVSIQEKATGAEWTGFSWGTQSSTIDASAKATDEIRLPVLCLDQQDAEWVALGVRALTPFQQSLTFSYQIRDGSSTYSLDKRNGRTQGMRQAQGANEFWNRDSKVP